VRPRVLRRSFIWVWKEKMTTDRTRWFEPSVHQVGAARRYAVARVREWGLAADALAFVVGELAANAVLHGRSPFSVSLRREDNRVVVEVADLNPREPQMTEATSTELSGRGLMVVDRLSVEWGVRRNGLKVVWALIDCRVV
jgi:anti-sigma regulatory factor (Ser/Thr protein kinase)